MTNTGFGKEGIVIQPKRHDEKGLRDWLRLKFNDLPPERRGDITHRVRYDCFYWFIQGGGDPIEFEKIWTDARV